MDNIAYDDTGDECPMCGNARSEHDIVQCDQCGETGCYHCISCDNDYVCGNCIHKAAHTRAGFVESLNKARFIFVWVRFTLDADGDSSGMYLMVEKETILSKLHCIDGDAYIYFWYGKDMNDLYIGSSQQWILPDSAPYIASQSDPSTN